MVSLLAEVQALKSELSTLQASESLHNLSLDEHGREQPHPASGSSSRPHNTKIQYFANLLGENFLAWRSQFQVIAKYHRWSDDEAKQLVYAYMKGTALESVMDISLTGPETIRSSLGRLSGSISSGMQFTTSTGTVRLCGADAQQIRAKVARTDEGAVPLGIS